MILLNKLKDTSQLSDSEKTIANIILHNTREVIDMNIEQLASLAFVSNSSIVRFCQKLGFKGFSDFKIKLASEINTFLINNERIEVDMPIAPGASAEDVKKAFLNLHYQTLTDTYHNLDTEKMQEIAECIHEADVISLWGQGPSMLVALDFHYKLKRLGYISVCDAVTGYHHIPKARKAKNEVAVIISSYGNSPMVRQWVSELRLQKRTTVLICANPHTPFATIVDHTLLMETSEKRVAKMGHFSSRIAINYAIDCLYAMLFSFNYDDNVKILFEEGKTTNERGEYLKNLLID